MWRFVLHVLMEGLVDALCDGKITKQSVGRRLDKAIQGCCQRTTKVALEIHLSYCK